MNARCILVTAVIIFCWVDRLPAPFQEVPDTTPTPKPKREAISKPKPRAESTSKPKATLNRSFAGTWTGNVIATSSTGERSSASYLVKISDDEKTVLVNLANVGATMSGPPWQFACARFRDALSWSSSDAGGTTTYTMRINADGTASFLREGRYTGGDLDGVTYTQTGTLSREGAVAPVLSGPQSTATPAPQATINTAAKKDGGLPVAKPVQNKPGFVYNPFDPTSKFLLDVRGKASGTKLIEPKSGKLFIVP
jgi:hypothetical protein